jgi:toxin ParE1/3/4
LDGQDLDEIWFFIAQDNINAADATMETIRAASIPLAQFPKLGRPGNMRRSRELNVAGTPYRLIYRLTPDSIEILRVVHGAREWPSRKRKRS